MNFFARNILALDLFGQKMMLQFIVQQQFAMSSLKTTTN
jgi:hypothetical protein